MSEQRQKSNYAKKHAWCARNGVWGFDVGFPKPWRKGAAAPTSLRRCRYAGEVEAKITTISRLQNEEARGTRGPVTERDVARALAA